MVTKFSVLCRTHKFHCPVYNLRRLVSLLNQTDQFHNLTCHFMSSTIYTPMSEGTHFPTKIVSSIPTTFVSPSHHLCFNLRDNIWWKVRILLFPHIYRAWLNSTGSKNIVLFYLIQYGPGIFWHTHVQQTNIYQNETKINKTGNVPLR